MTRSNTVIRYSPALMLQIAAISPRTAPSACEELLGCTVAGHPPGPVQPALLKAAYELSPLELYPELGRLRRVE